MPRIEYVIRLEIDDPEVKQYTLYRVSCFGRMFPEAVVAQEGQDGRILVSGVDHV